MKTYILTELERKLIKAYLEKGTTSGQLRTLKKRAKEGLPQLEEDLALVKKYLIAAGVVLEEDEGE